MYARIDEFLSSSYVEKFFAGVIVASLCLDGFNDKTRARDPLLPLGLKDLFDLGQATLIFGLIFSNILLKRIPGEVTIK